MVDYSQNGEQRCILDYFGSQVGTFLDIGANDGRTFSNTHALALKGWSGVCVDASPVAFASLQNTYRDNERIEQVFAAITNSDGPITLHQASDTLVSSLNAEQPKRWASYGFNWNAVEVPGMTFATFMASRALKCFDFISIDAEDQDIIILSQMNLDALGCKMLCIEHGGRQEEILAMCKGWRIMYGGDINLILAK